jgi:hypothetical protein
MCVAGRHFGRRRGLHKSGSLCVYLITRCLFVRCKHQSTNLNVSETVSIGYVSHYLVVINPSNSRSRAKVGDKIGTAGETALFRNL